MPRKNVFDMAAIRERLQARRGRDYWRSLNELAEDEEFRQLVEAEFPVGADCWSDALSRRRFLQVMGASLALAGAHGCTQRPDEKIVPYVQMPENVIPGRPLYFATAMPFAGLGIGLVVESHEGRPTKVEGNHLHPASLGATDVFSQASLLTLYDPDRSQAVLHRQLIASRDAFLASLQRQVDIHRPRGGAGLRILTETVSSPTLASQLARVLEVFPEARWHQYEPVVPDAALAGAERAFGRPVQTRFHFDRADVVLALGADFLQPGFWPPSYARHFIQRRRLAGSGARGEGMNRLYVVESSPSITGAKADHRLALRPGDVVRFARAVARRLGVPLPADGSPLGEAIPPEWIEAVVEDLQRYRRQGDPGGALVLAGYDQPAGGHALAHAMNQALGAVGTTVEYLEPVVVGGGPQLESLAELTEAMSRGQVETLIILGGNPVFNAPADIPFAEALERVPYRLHLGIYQNETSRQCQWHLPGLHYLEAWSDVRAFDGTASIIQPLLAPLYDGWSEHTVLAHLANDSQTGPYEIVRGYWRERLGLAGEAFERKWEEILRQGVIDGTAANAVSVQVDPAQFASAAASGSGGAGSQDALDVTFLPDPTIWDGRFANNGWLQELPKPLSKLTWDNAALLNPATAERLGLASGDMVRISHQERQMTLPVWVLPGQARDCLTLSMGYGRRVVGQVGLGAGFDVYPLRTTSSPWWLEGAEVAVTGSTYDLAGTQEHHLMDSRRPVEQGTLEAYLSEPEHPPVLSGEHHGGEATLFEPWEYESYKWGMVIDLTACVGCNACVIACQAENNIPVVGKQQVQMGREMHWIRIDTYYQDDVENPRTHFQPVPCMHCERAPCEVVCPVAATTHSDEGLNEMTYNRCIGTRYCSNNCPYKVRRFNFLQYSDYSTPVLELLRNPDVTVRSRGVMEKCTYCVQRINAARRQAKVDDRRIAAGEVETACQAACPTQAIVFGDLNNPEDPVVALREHPLNFTVLEHLNTQPRTTYLASMRNPNPRIDNGDTTGRS